jgi:hypothetical protein
MAREEKRGCTNLECRNGVTPGVVLIGGGKNSAPLIQNGVMSKSASRWGWVRCRACRPEDKDPPFRPKSFTEEQITERARLADTKAPYVQETEKRLSRIAASALPRASAPPPDNGLTEQIAEMNKRLSEMTEALSKSVNQNLDLSGTVGKLSAQVSELLAENARLRTAPQEPISTLDPPSGSPPAPKKRKSRQIAKPS